MRRAGELAEAVADGEPGRDLVLEEIAAMRQNHGDSGADARALDECDVSDTHPVDIGDGV